MKQNRIFSQSAFVVLAGSHAGRLRSPHTSNQSKLRFASGNGANRKQQRHSRTPPGAYGKLIPNEASTGAASGGGASDDSMVRVSIQLEKAPTIDAGFEIKHIAQNAKAMRYRDSLKQTQDQLQATIERQALHGQRLDVVWNLTPCGQHDFCQCSAQRHRENCRPGWCKGRCRGNLLSAAGRFCGRRVSPRYGSLWPDDRRMPGVAGGVHRRWP